jgi:hypothetical protein
MAPKKPSGVILHLPGSPDSLRLAALNPGPVGHHVYCYACSNASIRDLNASLSAFSSLTASTSIPVNLP